MNNDLCEIKIKRKEGDECFCSRGKDIDCKLLEFWQWNCSDLTNNANRGKLAEFIVTKALRVKSEARVEWDAYDVLYGGLKIEVKSASYIQTWEQSEYSKIIFGIRPTVLDNVARFGKQGDRKRQADIYVFCVLKHKDQKTINPLDMDQWDFYILPTKILDKRARKQKMISLYSLLSLNPIHVGFGGIKNSVDRIVEERTKA